MRYKGNEKADAPAKQEVESDVKPERGVEMPHYAESNVIS